jgi:hypothetical protein
VQLKLPNPRSLRVDRDKIVEYLLNHEHPEGRAKALFFERVGFQRWRGKRWRLRYAPTGEPTMSSRS